MLRSGTCILVLASLLAGATARIIIEPNPNDEFGMMSSETKFFNCKSDQRNANERLVWIDPNGREIVNDPQNRVFVTAKRSQTKLEFKNPTKQDSGLYRCAARDKSGREVQATKFKLSVYSPTSVSGAAQHRKPEGSNIIMECAANYDRDVRVDFTWMFGNYDLSSDNTRKYSIATKQESASSPNEQKTISRLEIRNLQKDHGGKYQCIVESSNNYISEEKSLDIELNVQYKPRFDPRTPKFVWVSEEAVRQGSPVQVNVTCLVQANPPAKVSWSYANGGAVQPSQRSNQMVTPTIHQVDNMSVLTLEYRNADEIMNPRPTSKIRYACSASNDLGSAKHDFEIKIGRIPEPPQAMNIDYKDGFVLLKLNDSQSEPAIDSFRLEVGEHAHVFNRTYPKPGKPFQEYSIEMPLSRGEHNVKIYSHNPVGWSLTPDSSIYLSVINGAPRLSLLSAFVVLLLSVAIGRF